MSVLDRFLEETLSPLMAKYINDENYYFIDEDGKRTWNTGQIMFDERESFHPILHPEKKGLVTAFWVDDAPLIYANEKYGIKKGLEFQPDESIYSATWLAIQMENSNKFIDDQGRRYQTHFSTFICDKDLYLEKEEAVL